MNIQCWRISENALQWSQSAMFEIGLDGFGEVLTENTLCRLGDPPTCQTDIFSFAFGGKALLESNENHSTFRNFTSCRYLLKNEIRGRGQKEEWNVVCVMMRMKRTARFEKQWLWDIFFSNFKNLEKCKGTEKWKEAFNNLINCDMLFSWFFRIDDENEKSWAEKEWKERSDCETLGKQGWFVRTHPTALKC